MQPPCRLFDNPPHPIPVRKSFKYGSKEYNNREKNISEEKSNLKYHAIVIRSVDQILPYCIISAEYPEAVKIGGMKMSDKQLKDARNKKNSWWK